MKGIFTLVVLVTAIAAMAQSHDEHMTSADPHSMDVHNDHDPFHGGAMKVELDNNSVQVIRIHIGPHQKIPMHDIESPRVAVLLTDEDLKITFPNGETREEHHKAGEVSWVDPQRHAGENLSDKPLEFITIVPKNPK